MDNLLNIIKEIISYQEKVGLEFSPDMILDCSTRIFNSQNIENQKTGFKSADKVNFEKATEKQIYALKKIKLETE